MQGIIYFTIIAFILSIIIVTLNNLLNKRNKKEEEILKMLFEDVEITETRDLFFECDCSKEHMTDALKTLGKKELEKIINEDEKAELTCHFCNKKYMFTKEELENIKNEIK